MLIRKLQLQFNCPCCRCPTRETQEQAGLNLKKRVEANDAVAMCLMGSQCRQKEDYGEAFEYYTITAAVGDAKAHFLLYQLCISIGKVLRRVRLSVYTV